MPHDGTDRYAGLDVSHVLREAGDWDAPVTPVRMWCGAEGLLDEDGESIPAGLDFETERDAEKATCPGCAAARALHNRARGENAD